MTYKPTREFNGIVGQPSKDLMGPETLSRDLDKINKMFDPAAIHSNGEPGGIGKGNLNFSLLDPGSLTTESMAEQIGSKEISELNDPENQGLKAKTVWKQIKAIVLLITNHFYNFMNPHAVNNVQVGLGNVTNEKQATKIEFDAHRTNGSNPHSVTKAQLELGNADNTSDLNKPVSTATLAALGNKVDKVAGKALSTNDYNNTEKTNVKNNTEARHTHSNETVLDKFSEVQNQPYYNGRAIGGDGSGSNASIRTAKFVIGTSVSGWTLSDCDYLCDGTDDQVGINNAITALPATGGEIIILDGTYNITAAITMNKNNTTLKGNGSSTILKRMFNNSSSVGGMIEISGGYCKVSDMHINGNRFGGYNSTYNAGIMLNSSSDSSISNNSFENNYCGIYILGSGDNNVITENKIKYGHDGIYVNRYCDNNTISNNVSTSNNNCAIYVMGDNNTISGNAVDYNLYGIYVFDCGNNVISNNICNSSDNSCIYIINTYENTVTGNSCSYSDNADGITVVGSVSISITGNACNGNTLSGISVSTTKRASINGNSCTGNKTGITMTGSTNSVATGNVCVKGNGTPVDYTATQYTILLEGTLNNYNLISSNSCMGKAVVIGGGTGNSSINNKWDATDDTSGGSGTAEDTSIADAGGYFTSANVEGALQESANLISTVSGDIDAHKADDVSQREVHGLRLNQDNKLEYFNGTEYVEVKGGGYPVNIVKNVSAKEEDTKVELMWEDPDDVVVDGVTIAEWNHTKVMRKVGSYPLHEEDGELVISSGVRNAYKDTPYSDIGLQNDTTYYYAMFPTTTEEIVTISEVSRVSATPTEPKIYGVEIDESNSNPETAVTYTDDAVGFAPMKGNNGAFQWGSWQSIFNEIGIKPCMLKNGVVQYYLNPNDYAKKIDGTNADITTGADGDVMIEFPKIYWKINRVGTKVYVKYSTKFFEGSINNAHKISSVEKDKIYLSAYIGNEISGKLRSLSGKSPTVSKTIGAFRTSAQANGIGYQQTTYYALLMLQVLYLVWFKNLSSKTALGRGYVDGNSASINTGGTNTKGMFFGETSAKQQNKFCGIEDFWGNVFYWIDGMYSDSNRNIMISKQNVFNDNGTGYSNHGIGANANVSGYINKVQGGNETGFIIKEDGGSSSTYFADGGTLNAGCLPLFGGNWSNGDYAGAFQLLVNASASNSYAYLGARSCFIGS